MYVLGHVALGYISGAILERFTGERFNIPLIMFVSLSPDLDFFLRPYLVHRSPTHSIIAALVVSLAFYTLLRRGLPYYAALATHVLIGDYFTGLPFTLLWPANSVMYLAPSNLTLVGRTEILVEVALFALMLALIVMRYRGNPGGLIERFTRL
jgi:membrane-bound metal-dependent hydrolase YbcI (DUF457 family)